MRRTAFASLLLPLLAASCGAPPPAPPPVERPAAAGIVLVSVDAWRPDLLGAYGGEVPTPALARLAAAGVTFEDAATVCPMARPSAAALLTGLAPDRSGVRDDLRDRVSGEAVTLARLFEESGRSTAAIVATPFCSHGSGLAAGFGLFDGPEERLGDPERYFPETTPDAEAAERFATWLGTLEPGKRFFAWVHLAGLHGQALTKISPEDASKVYRDSLPGIDAALGRILDALEASGRLAETAVVVAGTHGVLLGEDGLLGNPYWLRRETLRVPLVIKGAAPVAGLAPGTRSKARVWLPDVAATLAALGGVALPPGSEGLDLAGGEPPASRARLAWSWAPEDEVGWPTLTAVEGPEGWRSFTWEQLSGADAPPGSEAARSRPARPREREVPADLRARLEAAGLVKGWTEAAPAELEAPARDRFLTDLQITRRLFVLPGGNPIVARKRSRRALQEHPRNLAAMSLMLYVRFAGEAAPQARELADQALPLYPSRPGILHWSGHALQLSGEAAKGELLIEAALAAAPRDPELLYDLACSRALAGDADAAIERLGQAVEAGFRSFRHIEQDADLTSIRGDPRYAALLGSRGR